LGTGKVRVYLPASYRDLTTLVATGSFHPRAPGHAVTSALKAAEPDGDLDEWEFLAFLDAGQSSLALLEADATPRRVVLSADLDAAEVHEHPRAGASGVVLAGDVATGAVAAVHVDGVDAEPAVRAVLSGAPPGTLDDFALEWFGPDEVADLLT